MRNKNTIINIYGIILIISLISFLYTVQNYGLIYYKIFVLPIISLVIGFVVIITKWREQENE